MTFYPNRLSEHHLKTLVDGSGIAPEIIQEHEARTITRGSELPRGFSKRQRKRAPGILFTAPRPNGKMAYSFRPDEPDPEDPGRRYEQPSKRCGGPGNVLGVYTTGARDQMGDTSIPLVFVEGIKKALSTITAARAVGVDLVVAAISGVWNWLSEGAPIADMFDIPVEGRRVTVLFDSDMLRNLNVQAAARRLAEHLISREAKVWITYLPDQPDGSKTGADDFFVGGGTFSKLRLLTRPYDPADFVDIRMSRDKKFRAAIEYLWKRWREGDWMRFVGAAERGNWARGHTARDTMEALTELATQCGKQDDRGVVVEAGLRKLADMSAKSVESVRKAVEHLEADGQLEILPPEDKSKARKYRLLVPRATLDSMERETTGKGFYADSPSGCQPLRPPTAPRLRWSSPAKRAKLIRHTEGATGRAVVQAVGDNVFVAPDHKPYAGRLGPHRGAVIDALEAAGGKVHLEDLCEALHRKRPRDVRRRILKPLEEAGVIECEGDVIRLVDEWGARLEEERERKGEIEQAERQAEKHRTDSARYREYLERGKRGTPKASLDAVRRTKELRERRLREIRDEDERDQAPTPPAVEVLVARILSQHDRVRMGLLCEIAREEGLRWRDVPPAVRRMGYRVERLPEYDNNEFVFTGRAA
jgi:hypothetical protein